VYHLLDHCNARNAAELARTDLDARALGTLEWVPPSERLIVNEHARGRIQFSSTTTRDEWRRNLGYGAVVWCGGIFETPLTAPGSPNEQWTRLQATKRNRNVCRPFDEAHMMANRRFEWVPYHGNGGHHYDEFGNEVFWHKRFIGDMLPYIAKRVTQTIRPLMEDWIYKGEKIGPRTKPENESAEVATPPNHGHGAACGCVTVAQHGLGVEPAGNQTTVRIPISAIGAWAHIGTSPTELRSTRIDNLPQRKPKRGDGHAAVLLHKDESLWVFTPQRNCPHCAGTGSIICDDERAGCVSPSHAAGGYAKWRRRTGAMRWGSNVSEDYSITINDGRYSVRPNQAFSRNR
jgi:hypothetical protein